jgi:predicted acylesterase/phospholipase RssA
VFLPHTLALTTCTAYDRSDLMADVLSDELFDLDLRHAGRSMEMKDLNPERPYLILNAANATEDTADEHTFSRLFTFTKEDFEKYLASDVQRYEVGRAVMASAAFPGAFSYMTLRDYRGESGIDVLRTFHGRGRYMHVSDGGAVDNLGLESAKRVLLENHAKFRYLVVIAVDAHRVASGARRDAYDPRDLADHGIDTNLIDTFDMLLEGQRRKMVDEFGERILHGDGIEGALDLRKKMTFMHISFDRVKDEGLRQKLLHIPTSLRISEDDAKLIDEAMPDLVSPQDAKMQEIRQVLLRAAHALPGVEDEGPF